MTLNWDDLRYFLAVARTGKLTTAARRLHVDHATCSRRVAALETALAAKLFERRPQGYFLTNYGNSLMAMAEAMESQVLAAQKEVGGQDSSLSGTVRIGAPDGFTTYFLAPRIGQLTAKYPELEIQLVASPRLLSLSKREADIAISLNRPIEGKVVARKLTDYDLALFASRDYLKSATPIRTPQDLFAHPIIGYVDDLIFAPELNYLDEIATGLRAKLQSSNLIAQMTATVAGRGVCVLPLFMTAQQPTLVRVLPKSVGLRRSFWLTVHADLRNLARMRVISDFLSSEVRRSSKTFIDDGKK
ncbi:LysR family transcriptional regulator [Microbacteriaceae bacterium K1510]|nr:LysR family transcriptional regulator [Microbacteriaceae bacterium K1510]